MRRRILRLTGAGDELVRHVEDRPGHDRRYSLDSSKLAALGWRPEQDFERGLAETVEWYRANRAWWEPLKSGEYLAFYREQYARRWRIDTGSAAAAPGQGSSSERRRAGEGIPPGRLLTEP